MWIEALPNELLYIIAKMLVRQRDINALARTTRHLYSHLSPLYSNNVKYGNASALWFSVFHELPGTTRLLIEAGADLEIRDQYRKTPLHVDAYSRGVKVAKVLIEGGADMKAQCDWMGPRGMTAIHLAASNRFSKMVELLLEKGVDPDLANELDDFSTPVHYAADNGSRSVVRLLVKKGAQINRRRRNFHDTVKSDVGADIEAKRELHGISLFQAAVGNYEHVVRRLLKKKVNIEALFFDGNADNPLQAAILEMMTGLCVTVGSATLHAWTKDIVGQIGKKNKTCGFFVNLLQDVYAKNHILRDERVQGADIGTNAVPLGLPEQQAMDVVPRRSYAESAGSWDVEMDVPLPSGCRSRSPAAGLPPIRQRSPLSQPKNPGTGLDDDNIEELECGLHRAKISRLGKEKEILEKENEIIEAEEALAERLLKSAKARKK
ncbi:hypothetical protein N7510_011192 [Penicillium lagena]|uniref:uncharacterized protein n=1 Tax=Penicillium lagena TaxID=94218 RepID=UPI002541EE5B|nr:uncharacterized protein N7510_011192 [Penicillium lagena]KAJ5601658.1 hypothetical protein N7510_011192 [Penicillium lagena]